MTSISPATLIKIAVQNLERSKTLLEVGDVGERKLCVKVGVDPCFWEYKIIKRSADHVLWTELTEP